MAERKENSRRTMARVIVASSMGTAFEWYDFFIFGSLAPIISKVFFAGLDPTPALIAALAAQPMAWEGEPYPDGLEVLVKEAHDHAIQYAPIVYPFAIQTEHERFEIAPTDQTIEVPGAYLHGLLTRRYHWDNAFVGSNLRFRGDHRAMNRDTREFLNRFHR